MAQRKDHKPPPRIGTTSAAGKPLPWRRIFVGLAIASGLTLAAFLIAPLIKPPPAFVPSHTATIENAARTFVFTARFEAETDKLVIDRLAGEPAEGNVFALWYVADTAAPPVALGALSSGRRTEIMLSVSLAASVGNDVLIITEEPAGAEIGDAPSGMTLATGILTQM